MSAPEIEIWKCDVGGREIHIYRRNEKGEKEWLFGISTQNIDRSDIIEIMKIFNLEYDYSFLSQIDL